MSYIHIFTDGVDKLLSASIWFKAWGGEQSFLYYESNSLKGFVEQQEYEKLKTEGFTLIELLNGYDLSPHRNGITV